jgi:trk system potassium uptake protein TrkA
VTVGAILRGEAVLMAHGHVVIEADDHVILFLTDRTQISAVEKLFAVGFGFI